MSHTPAGSSTNIIAMPSPGVCPGSIAHPPPRLTLVHSPPLGWKPGGQVGVGVTGSIDGILVGVRVLVGRGVPMWHRPSSGEQKYPLGQNGSKQQTSFTQ